MAAGDRAAGGVEPRVVRRDADAVAPGEHLDGERLVQLEQADVVDREPGLREHALGRGHGPDAHQVWLDARVGEPDEAHRRLEPELGGDRLGGEQARRGAVGEPGRVSGGDPAARRGTACAAPRGPRASCRAAGTRRAPATRQPSSPKTLIGTTVRAITPSGSSHARGRPDLALERVRVGGLPRQLRERVVEVLGRLPHHGCALVDQPLADESRVEVDLLAHRVVAHVLDAADEHEVGGAHRDLAGARRRRRQRTGAHAVDREAGDGVGQPGEQSDVTSEREALVADLRRRGEDHVADALGRDRRVAAQQLAHDLHRHVVGARLPEEPLGPALPNAVRTPSTNTTSRSSRAMAGRILVD